MRRTLRSRLRRWARRRGRWGGKSRLNWLRREQRSYENSFLMRDLTPEEQEAVRQAVNDMRIEGFCISEERAMELVRDDTLGIGSATSSRGCLTIPPAVKER